MIWDGNTIKRINDERHVIDSSATIKLAYMPDDYYRVKVLAEGDSLLEGDILLYESTERVLNEDSFYVDYNKGVVYFHDNFIGQQVKVAYYGKRINTIPASQVYTGDGRSLEECIAELQKTGNEELNTMSVEDDGVALPSLAEELESTNNRVLALEKQVELLTKQNKLLFKELSKLYTGKE